MTAVALALAAAAAWAVSDFMGGLQSRTLRLLTVLAVSQAAGLAIIAAVVVARAEPAPGARTFALAAAAGVAGVIGIAAFYRGLAVGAMSVVAPVSALGALVPVGIGLGRGERPTALQLSGVAVALAGAVLVSRQPRAAGRGLASGAGLAVVAALGFGLFFVGIDAAREDGLLWAVLVVRAASTALVVAAAVGARTQLPPRPHWPALVAVGALDMAANALFAAATAHGYVSLVSVVASLYPVGVIALARVVLGERLRAPQLVGAAAALAGVALISAG